MKKILFGLLLLSFSITGNAQTDTIPTDNDSASKKKIKKGWTFGALPSVAFDADLGFQGGVLGNVYYYGIIGDLHYNWEFHTKSDGFLLTFTGLVIELFNSNFNQVIKDDKKNGYKIEIITEEDDHYIYTFYGLMEENEQESIRNVLTEFIPIFEELPEYMESKEEEYEEETEYLES